MSDVNHDNEKSEMVLKPHSQALIGQVLMALTTAAVTGFVAYKLNKAGLYTHFGQVIFCVMAGFALVSTIALVYLLNVMMSRRAQLTFEQGGMIDHLSLFSFGPISRQDIRKIKIDHHILFGTALAIYINPEGPAVRRLSILKGFLFLIYSLFFGGTIYFPLKWMGVTKHDLESRLMLYRQKIVTEEVTPIPKKIRVIKAVVQQDEDENDGYNGTVSEYQEVEITRPEYEKGSAQPALSDRERNSLIEKVEKIKQHVAQTRLDLMLCELYTDEISLWLEWEGHRDWPKPKELKEIKLVDNTINYQEISFLFHGKRFHFGLRRNVGSSQEALLSVSHEGNLRIALKVQVEIGSLTPKKLEQYIQGEWEQELRSLYDGIADLRGRRRAGLPEDDEPVTRTDVEIENTAELKRRFGV